MSEKLRVLLADDHAVPRSGQRIMEKLNLHHRSELVRYALKTGLLTAAE